ncbi:MAG: FAD-dependent oxidoreductase, partial [Acidobacteria bacterium]|nr:FAD-dependent oxidoreductase [Acidobacteriota bacterium]
MTESPAIDHVVVLGGGYAGLRIAVDLAASFRRHGLSRRISLVDRSAHHQLVTTLHRGATEARDLASCRLPLDELLVPGTVTRREATVAEIRPERREVLLEGGEALPYERLAVALGSSPARPEIDGLEEHGLALRRWSDAERLRDHVRSVLRHAAALPSREERKSFLTLVIAGGGATGCQLAGELAHWLPSLADDHGIAVDELELILLESGSSLLADSGAEGSRYAFETLRRKGVEVRLGASVDRVRPGSVR